MTTNTDLEPKMPCARTMQERLAEFGAHIDDLIGRAKGFKTQVDTKIEVLHETEDEALKRSKEALDELKVSLDRAWIGVNSGWDELRHGSERVALKLVPKSDDKAVAAIVTERPCDVCKEPYDGHTHQLAAGSEVKV